MASNTILFICVFTSLHCHFATCSLNSGCAETERKALMDFKGSLVDEEDILSSWTGRDCCLWYGITCHSLTGFVQMIDFGGYYHELGGHINSSLLNLDHLEYLDLSFNKFSRTRIPAFLGSLRSLRYLGLVETGFAGEIPRHIGNLSKLHSLTLGYESNSEISSLISSRSLSWITGLSSLKSLDLYHVNLSESVNWLDSINMLSSLSSLRLDSCELISMPLSHDLNLSSLVSLDLTDNRFNTTLPPSLFNLSSLENIWILRSSLRGPIPDLFQKLTALDTLDLSGNSFGSSLSDSLCALTGLTYVDFGLSELQDSIPFCLGNITNLIALNLAANELSGAIPGGLGFLTKLKEIYLGDDFSGKIPSALGKLTRLKVLYIIGNSLIGELSESFFEGLKSLEDLSISSNQVITLNVTSHWIPPFQIRFLNLGSVFIGSPFPRWLQTLTNLTSLNLRNTSISGVIPDWFHNSYPYMSNVDLSDNSLTGLVPTSNEMSKKASSISSLELSNNRFTGNIPDELCNLQSLEYLRLANNQLTGRIPSCLGSLRSLSVLNLDNNSLSDRIPSELGYLSNLFNLHLNGNKLSGELPSSLQHLTELRILDLSKNELHGFIPNWIGKNLVSLLHLMLRSNRFSGEIPTDLCRLPFLRVLDLEENQLVGIIPSCLANLSSFVTNDYIALDEMTYSHDTLMTIIIKGVELEYSYYNLRYVKFISLSGNHLHGEIPDEILALTELQSLNLSNNELTGKIPERIGNMKHLESLDLSRNHLSGTIPQSLADIDALSYLNLSFNNLSGWIPSGGHFDTLDDPSVYEGNSDLCRKPTTNSHAGDLVPSKENGVLVSNGDDEFEMDWIYAGIGPGFAVGLLGVFFLLYFKSSWRYRYFRYLENVFNKF